MRYVPSMGLAVGDVDIHSTHDRETALADVKSAIDQRCGAFYFRRKEDPQTGCRLIFRNLRCQRDVALQVEVIAVDTEGTTLRITGYYNIIIYIAWTSVVTGVILFISFSQKEVRAWILGGIVLMCSVLETAWRIRKQYYQLKELVTSLSLPMETRESRDASPISAEERKIS